MQEMGRQKWNRLLARAKAGDSEAQWQVGSWFEDGLVDSKGFCFVRPDLRTAVRWYRKSAEGGNSAGQANLGVGLSRGMSQYVPRCESFEDLPGS